MPVAPRDNSAKNRPVRIGIDVGGTFTDILLFDELSRTFAVGKVLTTPDDPALAVTDALSQMLAETGVPPTEIGNVVHGTTLVTNALIERKGATTALLTTRGFRDAIEIAREHRYDLYDLFIDRPEPLVPRFRRFEIDERILADGSTLVPLDSEQVRQVAASLISEGVEAVAIVFLHSYQNPDHERLALETIEAAAPDLVVSASHDVVPEIREYERTSTTVANVYVRPLVARYLGRLERALDEMGVPATLLIMLSSGGLCTVETATRFPIRLVESGPAAGALAAAHYGNLTGRPSLLSFDMGGTTAKCCLIDGGKPSASAEFEVSRVYRFKKGSGFPIQVPVVELIEIGAGGGSIARVDALGLLKVGPESAGADPGPASYGRGGTRPTVTDADLVLGYLDPSFFLGGTMHLDRAAAERAITPLADALGLSVVETAWGIHHVVNEQMAAAARIHAVERGKDPRRYPIFAFGGAGPGHAFRLAEILQSPELVVPLGAGVTSTVGFLVAPLAFDFVRSYVGRLDQLDWIEVNTRIAEMEAEGREILLAAGVDSEAISIIRTVELRYVGQGHQVSVPIPAGVVGESHVATLIASFESVYRSLYGRTAPGNAIEAINWRLVATSPPATLPLSRLHRSGASGSPRTKGRRSIFLPERDAFVEVPVYDRYALTLGTRFDGPCVIEERESTAIIGVDARIAVDELANLVVTMPRRSDKSA